MFRYCINSKSGRRIARLCVTLIVAICSLFVSHYSPALYVRQVLPSSGDGAAFSRVLSHHPLALVILYFLRIIVFLLTLLTLYGVEFLYLRFRSFFLSIGFFCLILIRLMIIRPEDV